MWIVCKVVWQQCGDRILLRAFNDNLTILEEMEDDVRSDLECLDVLIEAEMRYKQKKGQAVNFDYQITLE